MQCITCKALNLSFPYRNFWSKGTSFDWIDSMVSFSIRCQSLDKGHISRASRGMVESGEDGKSAVQCNQNVIILRWSESRRAKLIKSRKFFLLQNHFWMRESWLKLSCLSRKGTSQEEGNSIQPSVVYLHLNVLPLHKHSKFLQWTNRDISKSCCTIFPTPLALIHNLLFRKRKLEDDDEFPPYLSHST